jgi:hypothetical protein
MQSKNAISGIVLDQANMPIASAIVRAKATGNYSVADNNGRFTLSDLPNMETIVLTAWKEGYYIGGGEDKYVVGSTNAKLVLRKIPEGDNPNYQWISAFAKEGKSGNCENCHSDSADPSEALPLAEWRGDVHALSVHNIRFLTMYLGQDVNGNRSAQREYGFNRDYGKIPLRPNLSKPYFGPGYKLDFPDTAGDCADCHAPVDAINAVYEIDPAKVTGVGAEGVTCDFCHKVWDVRLDHSTGLPLPNMPGVLSFEFRRPAAGDQFFAGPFDDVAPGHDTYTPIQQQSQFCAACHYGRFWDTQIYNSFGEWLKSPYSNPATGKTCQACHMPQAKNDHFARLDKGGMNRDSQTIFSHRMPGASDIELLQNAVTMTANAIKKDNRLIIEVEITNDRTGHDIPTDSPLRQMILLVNVTDENGQLLPMSAGERVPDWGGVGDSIDGYYAGLPGKGFAKILSELWTNVTPSGSYWNPTKILSDDRIAAFATDISTYIFAAPAGGKANIKITLLFRRAFKELMDQKGWDVPDIIMEQQTFTVEK